MVPVCGVSFDGFCLLVVNKPSSKTLGSIRVIVGKNRKQEQGLLMENA